MAIARIENEDKLGLDKSGREQSILEKLLKDDRQVAIVMALDALMAGVDTVNFVIELFPKVYHIFISDIQLFNWNPLSFSEKSR